MTHRLQLKCLLGIGAQDVTSDVYLIASSTTLRHPNQFGQGAGAMLEAIGRSTNTLSYQALVKHWMRLNTPSPYFFGSDYQLPVWMEDIYQQPAKINFTHKNHAGYFIHAVVPCLSSDPTQKQQAQYQAAYRQVIQMTLDKGFKSIALTPLGIGVYGWRPELAGRLLAEVLSEFSDADIQICIPLFNQKPESNDCIFGATVETVYSELKPNTENHLKL